MPAIVKNKDGRVWVQALVQQTDIIKLKYFTTKLTIKDAIAEAVRFYIESHESMNVKEPPTAEEQKKKDVSAGRTKA